MKRPRVTGNRMTETFRKWLYASEMSSVETGN